MPGIFPVAYGWPKFASAICAPQLFDGIRELHLDFANTKKQSGTERPRTLYNPGEDEKSSNPPASGNQDKPGSPPPTPAQVLPRPVKTLHYGFDMKQLGQASHSGPNKIMTSLSPGPPTSSVLNKVCYPPLDLPERNIPIPVPEPIELDLVFFIAARRRLSSSLYLLATRTSTSCSARQHVHPIA